MNWPVAVVGAGTMGHGIAQVAAQHGFEVRLYDESSEALGRAKSGIELSLDKGMARGVVSREEREETLARINLVDTLEEAVEGCRIVIEAVPEDAEIKRSVFERLDAMLPETTILASNTSALSLTMIGSWTRHRERVIGLHFFNPPDRMPLVEVVRGLTTGEKTIERARRFCRQLGKETIVVADRPGFATSRLSATIGNEAWYMLMEGVASPEEIDKAVKLALGFPMGPFELGDLIGLDVRLSVLRYLHQTLGERYRPCPLLVEYVEAGYLGRKTGRGVYEYPSQDG
ncbi:MAG TPA: 3-hydroxyacyl-CoA dehydrogenase NAD-binding domain-containing protein [Actinomycetota bacterium]|jgi:3-hydroxybutyryl-CoA dehydrogenase